MDNIVQRYRGFCRQVLANRENVFRLVRALDEIEAKLNPCSDRGKSICLSKQGWKRSDGRDQLRVTNAELRTKRSILQSLCYWITAFSSMPNS